MEFNVNNIESITRQSDNFWTTLGEGQFWVMTAKKLEIHDKNGKIKGFLKHRITFATVDGVAYMSPFL